MNKKNNYIWIFGENLGNTANNNSFHFWKHIVNKKKENINKYIVLTKNKKNKKLYEKLNDTERRSVLWKNSFKHNVIYKNADMLFVTLSYKDVIPEKCFGKKIKLVDNCVPIIYLQHGTNGIKQLGYKGDDYYNNMFRFLYYNKEMKNKFMDKNGFRDYQLYYGKYHPRDKEVVRRFRESKDKGYKQITWFLTWREYLGNNLQTNLLIRKIRAVLKNPKLTKYLEENNIKLRLVTHQFFEDRNEEILKEIDNKNITIVNSKATEVTQELVDTDLMITDYSSVGFDATLLNKPVLLFFPDLEEYLKERKTYCSVEELRENGIIDSNELVNQITSGEYKLNNFFRSRLPEKIDYDYIEQGKHIDRMYKYFKKLQKNKITFLGYNFYGAGGTVSATRSLAEGLLEKGYLVTLLSLKKTRLTNKLPCGLNTKYLYAPGSFGRIKTSKILWKKSNFKYLKNDPVSQNLIPYVGYKLTKELDKLRSNTVVSTRESLHQFLIDSKSNRIKEKLYFYHCSANVMEDVFPGTMEELKCRTINKAVFVTERNRKDIEEKFDYNQYENFLISGNTIERKNCRNINKIKAVEPKEVYKGIYLLRINKERWTDLNNLISFAEYLKQNNIKNIVIDVFGDGDQVEQFLDVLEEKELMDIIVYKGKTNHPTYHIRYHDVVLDFSLNHSFGMTYIEGILNGKMVYCMKNTGSLEVMKDIPDAYIESFKDLVNKINKLPEITVEQLQENYRNIEKEFSRKVVSTKFIDFIKQ